MTFIDIFTDSLLAIEYYYQYNNRWAQSPKIASNTI